MAGPHQSLGTLEVSTAPDLLVELDGAARVPLLPLAYLVLVAPASHPDDPASILIEWTAAIAERPIPGSKIWRAAIEAHITQPTAHPRESSVQHQLRKSLERLPHIATWWRWVATGWTAWPSPARRPPNRRPWWLSTLP
jgi:hypothetical protein